MRTVIPQRGAVIDHHTKNFPLRPEDVISRIANHSLTKAFDHEADTAYSARIIIEMFQAQGRGWYPFSRRELEDWLRVLNQNSSRAGHGLFFFNRLVEPGHKFQGDRIVPWGGGWIIERHNCYWATEEFIWRCYFLKPINIHSAEDCQKIADELSRLISV